MSILCIGFLGTGPVLAQRNITWVGGLGDDGEFWEEYARLFERNRNVTSSNLDYATAGGVINVAGQIPIPANGANAIGIGHSLGGVALRQIDRTNPRTRIGGIITVGSPLNGSRIVSAGLRGEVNGYINHGVNEVSKGPLRQNLGLGFIVITASVIGRSLTGSGIVELLRQLVFDIFDLTPFDTETERNLAEGSQYMNGIRNIQPNVPRISIYGNENSPVHYRLASSARNDDADDDDYATLLSLARGVYNAQYIRNLVIPSPLNIWRAAGWKAGRDYWVSESEKGWNNLIGATRTESRQSCYEEWVCGNDYSCYDNIVDFEDFLACEELCYETVCRTITQRYNQPSDGLLHLSTQIGQRTNGVTSQWNPNATFEALGANHSEYDQHAGTLQHFNTIFNGGGGAPPFFITP